MSKLTRALVEILLSPYPESQSTTNILDSTFRPPLCSEATDDKGKADGSTQAQLMTGTIGVTQSPWTVPNCPACSPSLDVADQGRGTAPLTESITVGDEGVGGIAEEVDTRSGSYTRDRVSPSSVGLETAQVSGCMTSEYQASPADSRISTPLYLLASGIVDLVEFDHQYRDEEEAAAEEGALIEASGYPDPQNERNGR